VYALAKKVGAGSGVRKTLVDMGQTVAQNFGGDLMHGESFLEQL
jgi:phosphopentomutase